jgi:serine kinase
MVLEYADGGDALKYIQSTGAISEELARNWTGQITSAVGYMHKLDIAHRDLKLENLLIDTNGNNIKLCDFGFVREANAGDLSQTYCGSKSYAAPEILKVLCF